MTDLIIIDQAQSQGGQVPALERLRTAGDETPVVVLSSVGSIAERISALENGADDYIVKPVSVAELAARPGNPPPHPARSTRPPRVRRRDTPYRRPGNRLDPSASAARWREA